MASQKQVQPGVGRPRGRPSLGGGAGASRTTAATKVSKTAKRKSGGGVGATGESVGLGLL